MKKYFFLLIIMVWGRSSFTQDHQEIDGFTFVKQYYAKGDLPKELTKKLNRNNNIYASFDAEEMGYSDAVSKKFNSMYMLLDEEHFYAIDVNESGIEGIGFYNKNIGLLQHYKLGFDAHIQLSENENFIVVFNSMGNQIIIFNKDGNIIFNGDYQQLTSSNGILNNIFVDNQGEHLYINTEYHLYKINIESSEVIWKVKMLGCSLYYLHIDEENGLIFSKGSMPYGEKVINGAEFRFILFSAETGKKKAIINEISNITVLKNKLYLLKSENWHEYEIN